jgi:23S rRNA pseudouridine1911/1915/1917 synthase
MQKGSIAIIFQDHHLLVVNKPAGLVIHPTYKHSSGTMWDALLAELALQGGDDWQPPHLPDDPGWAGAPQEVREMLRARRTARQWREDGLLPRPCLLHRLDKDTSGIVALARTERARRHIVRQFHARTIAKRYLAVVRKGAPGWATPTTTFSVMRGGARAAGDHAQDPERPRLHEQFVLDGPLQRDPVERRRTIVGPAGQAAKTVVKILALSENDEFILLGVSPLTGRTHQIRAHLAAWGYTLVGDQVYAPPARADSPQAALRRQFLHAHSLELRRYPDNLSCTFVAPLAQELLAWLERYFPAGLGALYDGNTLPA